MHFKHISLLAAALVMLALGGCKKPEQGPGQEQGSEQVQPKPTPTPVEVEGKITITTGPLDATVASAGGTVTIAFTTDKEWTAKAGASWLQLGSTSGNKGENTLRVTVEAYDGYDDRTADVTITCGKDSKKLTITQKQKDAMILAPQTIEVEAEGSELDVIKLQANVEVTATSDADWITVEETTGTKGLVDLYYAITVAANESEEARSGKVTFISAAGSERITIAQAGKESGDPGDNPGDNPGGDPTPAGENDDLACATPPTVGTVDPTALVGYGAGVTGGEGCGSQVLHFNSGKALQTWLLQRTKDEKKGTHTPTVIWLSGTFKSDEGRDFSEAHPWFDVKDVSNLSFIGTDDFVMDKIGIFCVRAKNIIIRNINFQQPKANNGADAVSMQDCDGVWVDHCTFTSLNQTKDYEDGSTDITHGSKNVTVSWCRYTKTQKSCLVGHSNSQSGDVSITATFHHNWFEGSSSRHPRVRFGTVHVYNNLFDGNTTYGVGSAYGAKVLVEYNYFDSVQLPTDICTYPAKDGGVSNLQGSVAGYLYPTQNVYVNKPAKAKSPYPLSNVKYTKYGGTAGTELTYADFKPAYSYTVTAAADVPALVKAGAGYGKLEGFASAPIPVDNGGITDFDGTDDDPVDPDPGDGDDPGDDPGDNPGGDPGTPGTHTLYVGADKKIVGDTYFTSSESIADFSKDYSGSFTIAGTEYKYGLKMDSKGSVAFTTSSTLNTTVQFYFARRKADGTAKMQIVPDGGTAQEFDTPHDTYADSGVLTLEKGTKYTIKQKSGEQALILVKVTETE